MTAPPILIGAAVAIIGVWIGTFVVDVARLVRARSRWRRYRCDDCGRVFRSRVRYALHRFQPPPSL